MIISFDEFEDIASVGESGTGIEDVILWFGPNPNTEDIIVRVSNKPNDLTGQDIFIILLPNYNITDNVNKDFITSEKLQSIINFIELNKDNISNYSNNLISTSEFIELLKK